MKTLEEQLKEYILSEYPSVSAFSKAVDVPNSTLNSVLTRGISKAGVEMMISVFTALDLDIESISDGILRKKTVPHSDTERIENELIKLYRMLDAEDRSAIRGEMKGMLRAEKYKKGTKSVS